MSDVKITVVPEVLDTVLLAGSKSVLWQLDLYTEADDSSTPLTNAGKTMDAAMRRARKRALNAQGTILLKAFIFGSEIGGYTPVGTVAEFVRR